MGGNAPLPSKIACDFRRQRSKRKIDIFPMNGSGKIRRRSFFLYFPRLAFFSRVFSGHRSSIDARREPLFPPISILFPLPKEEEKIRLFSEGKKDQKSEENPFFFPSHFMAREKKRGSPQHVEETRRERPNSKNLDVRLRHRWLGKKILPFFPIPKESEERPSPQIPLESEGTRSRKKSVLFLSEKGPEKKKFPIGKKPLGVPIKNFFPLSLLGARKIHTFPFFFPVFFLKGPEKKMRASIFLPFHIWERYKKKHML